jgi:hypothetical protein
MISGGRYHLAHICALNTLSFFPFDFSTAFCSSGTSTVGFFSLFYLSMSSLLLGGITVERPKSHILTWLFSSTKMFAGLRSLCIIPAEWTKLMAHNMLYASEIFYSWSVELTVISFLMSIGTKSITRKTWFISSMSFWASFDIIMSSNFVVKTFYNNLLSCRSI